MRVTIFTPTYNRAYIIRNLYDSLCRQTCKDFEWVIVNDGSSDNTSSLITQIIAENIIDIKYFEQPNGGKHIAVNKGVEMASGELFFIVDSDDYITDDAVEQISRQWNSIKDKTKVAGLCFRKIELKSNTIIGKMFPADGKLATSLQIMYKWQIRGDKAEVFRTAILRKFPFPTYSGEKFVTEALIWNKIAKSDCPYLCCINSGIYYCDYLTDGLTFNFNDILRKNPKSYTKYYLSLLFTPIVWRNPLNAVKISVRLLQTTINKLNR